ncbi:matrix metalloproteinase-24-like isoform X1 [Apis mellifera caucasica]|uniref:Matrix metalloproteinase-24-like isoform X1 n=1 Tax=Apis mellifera TaxID=7460 RepID=A0A7M7IQR8_APIME|nr:matrix metalloproteinase-24-like isoform X1 [Apis mellifera]KAG6804080.1 matrix metalloproteinase-24-like isoform X1 [Apis mellifera caucasica]|eukprot:XP_016768267.1 matrix metalloproteinase-24-like isoform X1 [Apis mellifera]
MELFYIFFYIFFLLRKCESIPIDSVVKNFSSSLSAIDFMKKYGYLESGIANSDALYQKTAITNAVKTLQKFGNIPITGQLDNATLELMASPRCGLPDILRKKENQQRKKRYIISLES